MNAGLPIQKFTTVDVRDVWPHEAADFTPWLAEHPDYLTDALGLELDIEATEVNVGAFRVDMTAREVGTETRVIVENQLEPTNHGHLGQLIAYAAGLEAGYVVWIATHIRDEHRSALRWLNENTKEGFGFFGIEVETVQIGSSPVGVRLNVVERPDNWAKATSSSARSASPKELLYQEYWTGFIDELHEQLPGFTRVRTAPTGAWVSMSTGRSYVAYVVSFTTPSRIRVELYVDAPDPDAQEVRWQHLLEQKPAIESRYGTEPPALEWEPLPTRRASRIAAYDTGTVENRDAWPTYRAWMVTNLSRFKLALQDSVDTMPN